MILYCPRCTQKLIELNEGYYICSQCSEQWYIECLEE